MYVVAVSGTPGTGKTTFSKRLCRHFGFEYLDVSEIIGKYGLSEGFDKQRQCEIVDEKKLLKRLKTLISAQNKAKDPPKGIVIDSHLSHYLSPEDIDLCIITKTPLKTLRSRLKRRGYTLEKIRENLDAEIFDVCYAEALERGHTILLVESPKVFYYYSEVSELLGI